MIRQFIKPPGGFSKEFKKRNMKSFIRPSTGLLSIVYLSLAIALSGCGPQNPSQPATPTPTPKSKIDLVNAALAKGGKLAANTFYACVANGYIQGLPRTQIFDQCSTKLLEDNDKGFGGPMGDIKNGEMFDPGKIVGACNPGDQTHGQTSGYGMIPDYGRYTWGGNPGRFYGYSQDESKKLKDEAIKDYEAADKEFWKIFEEKKAAEKGLSDAKKTGDQAAIDNAQKKVDDLKKKLSLQAERQGRAKDKADADPNERPPNVTRAAEESPCQQVMDAARELLRECNRTDWKDARCQSLQAKMNNCPDPALILVDPDVGYSCGSVPDKEAVKDAWVKKCEQLARYGPDGSSPCEPPKYDGMSLVGTGKMGSVCNDPKALADPESAECYGTLEVSTFGRTNIDQIALWGMNNIGGPIIVFPKRDPKPPRPGPEPRTSPR